ncbi:MAG: hypothetical protein IKO41_11355 [Lachnospiraceae bacterium]|nr:hypothetical protein [Lachnospiraceae bacterium]
MSGAYNANKDLAINQSKYECESFSEDCDKYFLGPLADFCKAYTPKYGCSLSLINAESFTAIGVTGASPNNVKEEAERAYYFAGEFALPHFGNGHSYFAITYVFDDNGNVVLAQIIGLI